MSRGIGSIYGGSSLPNYQGQVVQNRGGVQGQDIQNQGEIQGQAVQGMVQGQVVGQGVAIDPVVHINEPIQQQNERPVARIAQEVVDRHQVYRAARNIPPGEDVNVWNANHNVRGREARGGGHRGYGGQHGGYEQAPRRGRGRMEPNWQVEDQPHNVGHRGGYDQAPRRGRGRMEPNWQVEDQPHNGRGRGANAPMYQPQAEGGGFENQQVGWGRGRGRYHDNRDQEFQEGHNQQDYRDMAYSAFNLMHKLADKMDR